MSVTVSFTSNARFAVTASIFVQLPTVPSQTHLSQASTTTATCLSLPWRTEKKVRSSRCVQETKRSSANRLTEDPPPHHGWSFSTTATPYQPQQRSDPSSPERKLETRMKDGKEVQLHTWDGPDDPDNPYVFLTSFVPPGSSSKGSIGPSSINGYSLSLFASFPS